MLERPALKQFYEVAGRRVLLVTQDEWCADAVADLFDGWFLNPLPQNGTAADGSLAQAALINIRPAGIPPTIPDNFVEFEIACGGVCHTDGQSFHLDFDGSSVIFGAGPTRRVDVWFNKSYEVTSKIFTQIFSQAFSALLRRCDLFELPSAGVLAPGNDKAVLLAGPSGAGKSTLTLQLARCGWRYLSDDALLLDHKQDGIEAHALRRFFALTEATVHEVQLPGLNSQSSLSFKSRVTPKDLFPLGHVQSATMGAIFFMAVDGGSETRAQRLSATDAMTRLLRLCPWAAYDKPTAGKHLSLLGKLARNCKPFDLFACADILENPSRVASLMGKVLNT